MASRSWYKEMTCEPMWAHSTDLIQPIGTDQACEINGLCTSAKTSRSLCYHLSVSTCLTRSCAQTNKQICTIVLVRTLPWLPSQFRPTPNLKLTQTRNLEMTFCYFRTSLFTPWGLLVPTRSLSISLKVPDMICKPSAVKSEHLNSGLWYPLARQRGKKQWTMEECHIFVCVCGDVVMATPVSC